MRVEEYPFNFNSEIINNSNDLRIIVTTDNHIIISNSLNSKRKNTSEAWNNFKWFITEKSQFKECNY